jgi:hypothetical protein
VRTPFVFVTTGGCTHPHNVIVVTSDPFALSTQLHVSAPPTSWQPVHVCAYVPPGVPQVGGPGHASAQAPVKQEISAAAADAVAPDASGVQAASHAAIPPSVAIPVKQLERHVLITTQAGSPKQVPMSSQQVACRHASQLSSLDRPLGGSVHDGGPASPASSSIPIVPVSSKGSAESPAGPASSEGPGVAEEQWGRRSGVAAARTKARTSNVRTWVGRRIATFVHRLGAECKRGERVERRGAACS